MYLSFLDCSTNASLVGDGVCNDEVNNADCNYDEGDCCGYYVNTDDCSDCICYHNETCIAGAHPLVANGFCNDDTNNVNCNYDGGDCCQYDVTDEFCSDCKCYHIETCVAGTHPLVADGFCNDKTNNADCDYDGGDCCGSCTQINKCTECTCLVGDDDTCHCKPNFIKYYSHFSNGVKWGFL